ncbi:type I DNA topoisomerase [Metamycoplasma neophronis]|uniref:DNA topoisomerase 1 n=1 Tax=Metamycoplasma neophronis TaxID=872983 RepID=A0ABY2Z031_9BACT|nr:type I DNA topoisomerase [Metamycoplasma neophronis]TPR54105.1 type I DNA topoisomerase [Metamycoplasma neophronis]
MSDKVMIVESPNKVRTIQKYVGDDVEVLSCVGHILKLSTRGKGNLGIDFDNWEPKMVEDPSKKKIISELKAATKDAKEVLIATDPDREGEAIASNLVTTLKIENKYKRIKYNEITNEAIQNAINNPHEIDVNLVDAQKARRMLDRIIGFKLSQLMQRKVKNTPTTPSAGRVQSIALKLVVDREKEIAAFIPVLYSKIEAIITEEIQATFFFKNNPDFKGENTWIKRENALKIINELNKNPELIVSDYKISQRSESMITPFKQSVLYKEAKYSSSIVQISAQKLFEAGLISYPRTDSTRMSDSFVQKAKEYIANKFGPQYVAHEIKGFSGEQDAHEAIRPTDIYLTPEKATREHNLNDVDSYIYKLIYDKTIMAIMATPKREIHQYELKNNEYYFRMSYSNVIFDGYYVISGYENAKPLPKYNIGDRLHVENFFKADKETNPPARYNEGSLIKTLDDIKVGRPSTFASTVNIIKNRMFVESKNGTLYPTDFGTVVLEKLVNGFPKTMNEEYTAEVEQDLDLVSEGKENYKLLMQSFWEKFNENLDDASQTIEITVLPQEKLDELCPQCGSELVYRYTKAKHQKFIGCSNFPSCHYIRNIDNPKKRFFKKTTKK